jgi:hypothetical protein
VIWHHPEKGWVLCVRLADEHQQSTALLRALEVRYRA